MSSRSRLKLPVLALAGVMWVGACSSDDNGGGDESSPPVSQSSSAEETEASPSESAPTDESPTESDPSESGDGSASPTEPTESESGDGDSPSPEPSQSGSADDESPAPSDTPSESSSEGGSEGAGGLPPMPAAAKENSEEGAEAFARWYVETLNYLYQHPQTGILEKYAGPDCKGCATQIRVMERSVEEGEVAQGEVYSILGSSSLAKGKGDFQAVVAFRQHPVPFVNDEGEVVDEMSSHPEFGLLFDLAYKDGWTVMAQYSNEDPSYETDPS
ncbi:DUF6318 family protein [Kytococcus sedentarius]|uniref:DUF6318 family protein n=1 Tax=Kytococcus sedentarius TaxID=1276 RepID=UPI0035BC8A70